MVPRWRNCEFVLMRQSSRSTGWPPTTFDQDGVEAMVEHAHDVEQAPEPAVAKGNGGSSKKAGGSRSGGRTATKRSRGRA